MIEISPSIIVSKGNLQYEQGSRSFSVFRLKASILDYFGMRKIRDKRFSYKLEIFGYNYEAFKLKIQKSIDEHKVMPVLFYLYEEDIHEQNTNQNN